MRPPPRLLLLPSLFVALLLTLTTISQTSQGQATQKNLVALWLKCGDSVGREDVLWRELRDSLQRCPPWSCRDAHRPELYEKIEMEHTNRLKWIKEIESLDK